MENIINLSEKLKKKKESEKNTIVDRQDDAIEYWLDELTELLYESGYFQNNENSIKDYTLLCEALVACAYRAYGKHHPFHQLADDFFNVNTNVDGTMSISLNKNNDITGPQSNTYIKSDDAIN